MMALVDKHTQERDQVSQDIWLRLGPVSQFVGQR